MGFFNDLRLKNRMAKRLGAFLRGRDQGMTAEEAHAYSRQVYPPTAEDLEYEARVREKEARRQGGA
jgi:hypothetical protein